MTEIAQPETLHQMYRRHDDEARELSRKAGEALGRYYGLRQAERAAAAAGEAHMAAMLARMAETAWTAYELLEAGRRALHAAQTAAETRMRAAERAAAPGHVIEISGADL
jgi:hypothetical protein